VSERSSYQLTADADEAVRGFQARLSAHGRRSCTLSETILTAVRLADSVIDNAVQRALDDK